MHIKKYIDMDGNLLYEGAFSEIFFVSNKKLNQVKDLEQFLTEKLRKVNLNGRSNVHINKNNEYYELKVSTGLACNLSCPHCYQTHDNYSNSDLTQRKLNDQTVIDKILTFIEYMTRNNLFFHRTQIMGGEPLLSIHYEKIDKIMQAAIDHGLQFGKTMNFFIPTNAMQLATFMPLFRKFENNCIIQFAITLAGLHERHNKIRPQKERGTFKRTLEVIEQLKTLTNSQIIIRYHVNQFYPFQFEDEMYEYYEFILCTYFDDIQSKKISFIVEKLSYDYGALDQIETKVPDALIMIQHAYVLDKVATNLGLDIMPYISNGIKVSQTREKIAWYLYWFGREGLNRISNSSVCPVQHANNILIGEGGMGICESIDHDPVPYANSNEDYFEKVNSTLKYTGSETCKKCQFQKNCVPCNKSNLALKQKMIPDAKCNHKMKLIASTKLNQEIYSKFSFTKPIRSQLEVLKPLLDSFKSTLIENVPDNIAMSFYTDNHVADFIKLDLIQENRS